LHALDWAVLIISLIAIVVYGLWKGRNSRTAKQYLLGGREMPWYAMALSIMATQASAITFLSTTGQAYVDGMRFVQYYFGLPIAMVLICAVAVPRFHSSGVYTAYEYLERRFGLPTRTLVSLIFLVSRGLGAGVALSAPALVLNVIFGIPYTWCIVLMGALVVFYTTLGGIKAVTWTDFQQMLIMMVGLIIALYYSISLLPAEVSFHSALTLAAEAGRLNAITTSFAWDDRYNVWSGLFGGTFLALAYFGTDQSQVQRYLTGRDITQSRLSLLFNALAKIPMQFLILFTGAMVFIFYTFTMPPMVFNQEAEAKARRERPADVARAENAWQERRAAATQLMTSPGPDSAQQWRAANKDFERARKTAAGSTNDTNYIFLTFVIRWLPAGVVGLVLAAIFAAAMSTISAEINSLATVTVIDLYHRYSKHEPGDGETVLASRLATVFWGAWAMGTALYAVNLGSLVETVNMLGSLFYGGMLGVFILAFFFPRIGGTAAFAGVVTGELAIFAAHANQWMSFLWYNVLGCAVVLLSAGLYQLFLPPVKAPSETAASLSHPTS
jgi:Na+/proline symporter